MYLGYYANIKFVETAGAGHEMLEYPEAIIAMKGFFENPSYIYTINSNFIS
jgi:hypothetical protein